MLLAAAAPVGVRIMKYQYAPAPMTAMETSKIKLFFFILENGNVGLPRQRQNAILCPNIAG